MRAMYTALLITHFLGLAIGLGSGFAQFTLALATRDLAPPERGQFMQRAAALGKNGSFGLLLLILSGIGMTTMRGWPATMQWGGVAHSNAITAAMTTAIPSDSITRLTLGRSAIAGPPPSRRARRARTCR